MKTTVAFYLRDRYYQMDGELSEEDFEKAEEMEEEHIKDAYKADLHPCSDEDAEQYYNQTFKQ